MINPAAPTSRVVRVFISSTFRDFGAERDLLMERVSPKVLLEQRERGRMHMRPVAGDV